MKRLSGGYTIIEVMIFLVVTATLLISAMAVFNGRQGRTEYVQSARETDQQLLTIINEVATGYFPDQGNFSCSTSGGRPVIDTTTSESQGTNENCIFLGKAILFDQANPDVYSVYPVAGARVTATGEIVDTVAEAQPVLVPNLVQEYNVPYSNTFSRIADPAKTCPTNASLVGIVFMQSLGAVSSGDPISGSQTVDKYTLCADALTEVAGLPEVGTLVPDWTVPAAEAVICFEDGPDPLDAAIKIGTASGKLNTEVLIDNTPAVCL
jgi:type II secretory pathway pseudopilin PulG